MDCEAFEASMIDELYGELDELTSAAMKRHASGCARCAALLDGLRATRKLAAIPMVDVPPALTDRILAVAQQHTSIPLGRRIARVVSVGGTWAMRPQSAMAAVFMVMLGTSLLLLRGRSPRAPTDAEVTVTEHGTPAPAVRAPVAQAAPEPPVNFNSLPAVPMASAAAGFPAAAPVARAAEPKGGASMGAGAAPMADQPAEEGRSAKAAARAARDDEFGGAGAGLAAGGGGAFAAPPPGAAAAPAAAPAPYAANATGASAESTSPFDSAVRLYESGRFDEATRAFEALAGQDVNADLYAARSIREGKGCRAALGRFDRVSQRAGNTPPGWDALLEGGICYRSVGDFTTARQRLTALLSIDSHRDRARAELDRMGDGPNQGAVVASPAAKARPAKPAAAAPAAGGGSP